MLTVRLKKHLFFWARNQLINTNFPPTSDANTKTCVINQHLWRNWFEFCYLCSYLKVPPASFSLLFWAGVKAAVETCLETHGTGRDTKSQWILQVTERKTRTCTDRRVIRLTSSPGCSSLSWTCCCPSMMRPGAWFLRVTMGVVGKVTWGLNIALCCWGCRTCKGKVSNAECHVYFMFYCAISGSGNIFALCISHKCHSKLIWVELTFEIFIGQFTSEGVCPGLLMPGGSWGLLTGAVRWGTGLPRTTVVGVVEVEVTGLEAVWGSWLCWMKAAESGVSCLKAGRLLYRRQTGGQTLQKCT